MQSACFNPKQVNLGKQSIYQKIKSKEKNHNSNNMKSKTLKAEKILKIE